MTSCGREEEWHALEFNAANKRIAQTKRFISCTSSRDPQTAFQQTEKKVCEQRQQRGRYGACQDDGVADHRYSTKNKCADRKSTRLNSSHQIISYAVFCLKKKNTKESKTDAMTNDSYTNTTRSTQ